MLTRILLCLALLFSLVSIAGAVGDQLTIKNKTRMGTLAVEPGLYKVKLQGSLLFITDLKTQKSVTTVVTVEKLDKKSEHTAISGPVADGTLQAESLVLQGADYKMVFGR